jgi:hypothetical protein
MTEQYLVRYAADLEIQTFAFQTKTMKWWDQDVRATDGLNSRGKPPGR